jgi:general secretion pathway protein E
MSATLDTPIDLDQVKIDPAWALRVPASLALRRQLLPFACVENIVYVACNDASDKAALEAVERFTGRRVAVQKVERESLQRALARVYGDARPRSALISTRGVMQAQEVDNDDPVAIVEELLRAAILRQASDIHIDPSREDVRVRMRVDGALEDYRRLPSLMQSPLTSRIKVLANMDIAEKRAPQDGGFTHRFGTDNSQQIDLRIASLPTKYGERLTIRLLASNLQKFSLQSLGMDGEDLELMERVIAQPHGLILLTGPTGSGKSTTLYAAIQHIMKGQSLNVITIEDPIEYEMAGVAQVEVDSADKVSFSKALRSVLRHDPDVVMIGEIRDKDTLDIAVKSSLTGHLVLSTLHTNSAASAVTRLIDMGLEPFLYAATLRVSVAQRLVRRICQHCRVPRPLSAAEAKMLGNPNAAGQTVYDPKGCLYCAGRGYTGRLGLFEFMPMDPTMGALITSGATESEIAAAMFKGGASSLQNDGCNKVLQGLTTVKDVVEAAAAY